MKTRTPIIYKETYAMLQYLVAVHGIFFEILLNKNWNLSKPNIEREQDIFTKIIDYFRAWIAEQSC